MKLFLLFFVFNIWAAAHNALTGGPEALAIFNGFVAGGCLCMAAWQWIEGT